MQIRNVLAVKKRWSNAMRGAYSHWIFAYQSQFALKDSYGSLWGEEIWAQGPWASTMWAVHPLLCTVCIALVLNTKSQQVKKGETPFSYQLSLSACWEWLRAFAALCIPRCSKAWVTFWFLKYCIYICEFLFTWPSFLLLFPLGCFLGPLVF